MTSTKFEIRAGTYFDSVVLMQLQKSLVGLDGVEDAGVVMATPANKEVLTSTGFSLDGISVSPDDMLIVVKAADDATAADAISQVDALLKANRTGGGTGDFRPKSLNAANELRPDSNWVLVSVPGKYAAGVVHEALDLGKHVFLYSDNVSMKEEAELKQKGRDKGLLVMGPDCGTAIINGVGLGFANKVNAGNIGIVAASGTGAQAASVGIHSRGGGVSQVIGTGGRDLKSDVGGITFMQGLQLLANDDATDVIVLISKPPSTELASKIIGVARGCGKPVVINFIGLAVPVREMGNLIFATSLDEAAKLATKFASGKWKVTNVQSSPLTGFVRGLFSGGTLAYETVLGMQLSFAPLFSNVAIRPEQKIADVNKSVAHTIIDMGEDEFTQGRLHPMMDNDLRLRRFRQEAADPETGLILLDVVLGEGSHVDPVSEIGPLIAEAKGKRPELEVVCLVVASADDLQDTAAQITALKAAGAVVYRTVGDVLADLNGRLPVVIDEGQAINWSRTMSAINVGVETFYNSLQSQGAEVIQVEWRPPAGGNQKMMDILAKFKKG
ncbi:MAG: FdrA protein [Cellvibrionaceae bacterium]|jgi:FdrA protein